MQLQNFPYEVEGGLVVDMGVQSLLNWSASYSEVFWLPQLEHSIASLSNSAEKQHVRGKVDDYL